MARCRQARCGGAGHHDALIQIVPASFLKVVDPPTIWWNSVPHKYWLFIRVQKLAKYQAILGTWNRRHVSGHKFVKSLRILTIGSVELFASLHDFRCVCFRYPQLNGVVGENQCQRQGRHGNPENREFPSRPFSRIAHYAEKKPDRAGNNRHGKRPAKHGVQRQQCKGSADTHSNARIIANAAKENRQPRIIVRPFGRLV